MTATPTPPPEKPKAKPSKTRAGLSSLRNNIGGKEKTSEMARNLLVDYKDLPLDERKQRVARFLVVATMRHLFEDEGKEEHNEIKKKKKKRGKRAKFARSKPNANKDETKDDEPETKEQGGKPKDPFEDIKEVGSNDRRLSLINVDPAGSRAPAYLKVNPMKLCKYGVAAKYENFEKEMIGMIAPKAKSREEGLKKVISVFRASPMGKYQCMPQYLFPYVKRFKHLDWKKHGEQTEEKLRAVWEFLQNESLQREACRGYVMDLKTKDPLYIAVGYYAGADDIAKLRKYLANKSNAKEQESMEKKQGVYTSKLKYAQSVAGRYQRLLAAKNLARKVAGQTADNSFDIELMMDAIGWKESRSYKGVTKPRDENWRNDKRVREIYPELAGSEASETIGQPEKMKTRVYERKGVPDWKKDNTDNWNYKKVGNTDANIRNGKYHIEAVKDPLGYTRHVEGKVPKATARKLANRAKHLRKDPKMPLFTSIKMTVDGIQVIMVKEIHIHPMGDYGKSGLSDYYYQPHTGVSYLVKENQKS